MKLFLLGDKKSATTQSFIWYSLGGLLNAGQSALILIVISRTNGLEDSGVYSIAYAIACLASTVGLYGMRNYQVTDVNHKYSFCIYLKSRIITSILMMFVIIYYIVKGILFLDYSYEKCLVILLLGLMKYVDIMEDVFHAKYQAAGRLDIAGRCMTTRFIMTLISFSIALIISANLVISVVVALFFSFIYFIISTKLTYSAVDDIKFDRSGSVYKLLFDCFVLFAGSYLAIYIANAPKYAIDEICTEVEQANYNYIFMPVYFVSVLNTFIYQPVLARMAEHIKQKKYKFFMSLFYKQICIIVALLFCVLLVGYLFGIPALSVLYNADLSEHKAAFIILLIGSGFLATEGYIQAIITILRKQNWLMVGFVLSSLVAMFCSNIIVNRYGILGAAALYTGIVFIRMLTFLIMFCVIWKKQKSILI